MITQQDVDTIKVAILKNASPEEKETAIAMLNVGLHTISLFERFVIAIEKIAIK